MEQDRLIRMLMGYGADLDGIKSRFQNDCDLYRECFAQMIADPNFTELEHSLAAEQYRRAFLAAHALKGLSANMGILPLYEAIAAITEPLRSGLAPLPGQYEAVETSYRKLLDIARLCDIV